MRMINLPYPNHVPMVHDLIKNTVILLVIEFLQFIIIGEPIFDKLFLIMLAFTIIGNLVYYLLVDKYLIGVGPILISKKTPDDKEE